MSCSENKKINSKTSAYALYVKLGVRLLQAISLMEITGLSFSQKGTTSTFYL